MELTLHQFKTVEFDLEGGWCASEEMRKYIEKKGGSFTDAHQVGNNTGKYIAKFPWDTEIDLSDFQLSIDCAEHNAKVKNAKSDEAFNAMEKCHDEIEKRLEAEGQEVYLRWSMEAVDLDAIAIQGEVNIRDTYTDEDYNKRVFKKTLNDPTWYDIAKACNELIKLEGESDHIFLEDFYEKKNIWRFSRGS